MKWTSRTLIRFRRFPFWIEIADGSRKLDGAFQPVLSDARDTKNVIIDNDIIERITHHITNRPGPGPNGRCRQAPIDLVACRTGYLIPAERRVWLYCACDGEIARRPGRPGSE